MDRIDNPDDFPVPLGEAGDTGWYVVPADHVEEDVFSEEDSRVEEVVERQLAHYGFVREERDREVRLQFRDTPPADIARAFRAGGAYLITLMGERVAQHQSPGAGQHSEATVRYFYNLGETVYTVSIIFTSGIAESVAGVYPSASRLEHEVSERSAIVFTPGMPL